jgi:hypothetical protein
MSAINVPTLWRQRRSHRENEKSLQRYADGGDKLQAALVSFHPRNRTIYSSESERAFTCLLIFKKWYKQISSLSIFFLK